MVMTPNAAGSSAKSSFTTSDADVTRDRIPRFGPLFWSTLTVACVLIVAYVGWRMLPSAYERWKRQSLIQDLADSDSQVREKALRRLQVQNADTVPHLIALLDHSDVDVRAFAARELIWLRPKAQEAIGPLIRSLKDEDALVRFNAAYALGDFGEFADPELTDEEEAAVRALCRTLNDQDKEVRETCVYALANFVAKSARAKPAILSALEDRDVSVRLAAAWILLRIDSQYDEQAVPILAQGLSSKDAEDRRNAVLCLGQLGPQARDAVPALIELLEDKDSELRSGAAKALGSVGPQAASAVPTLVRLLREDEDYFVRCDAAEALGRIGPGAKAALPFLRKVPNDGGGLPDIAAQAIQGIAPKSAEESRAK